MTKENSQEKSAKRYRRGWTIWIILFTAIAIYGIAQNRNRIDDIQKSRLYSCQRNYIILRKTFRPYFPPKDKRTKQQDRNIKLFIKRTDPRQCFTQVKPK